MAFPSIAGVATSQQTTNTTTSAVTLPASVAAGDLVVGIVAADSGAGAMTWPSPWVEILDVAGTGFQISVGYLIASGGETNVNVTHTTERSNHIAFRVAAADWHGTTPPEITTAATGSSTAPNSGLLAPSWGSEDTLFVSLFGVDDSAPPGPVTGWPTNYTLNQTSNFTATSAAGVAMAARQLAAVSDDPGAFTLTGTETWSAFTLAIRPKGAVKPRSTSIGTAATSGTTVTGSLPSGWQTGDFLLAGVMGLDRSASNAVQNEAGWTALFDDSQLQSGVYYLNRWFYKTAAGGESNPTFDLAASLSTNSEVVVVMLAFDPAVANTALASAGNYKTASWELPALTVGAQEMYLIGAWPFSRGATSVTSAPANYSVLQTHDGGTSVASEYMYGKSYNQANPGVSGFTMNNGGNSAAVTIAVGLSSSITGTAALTDELDTMAANALEKFIASSALTDELDLMAAQGPLPVTGTAALTDELDTLVANALERFLSTAGLTDEVDLLAANALEKFLATAGLTDEVDVLSASGALALPVTGTATLVDEVDQLSGLGIGGPDIPFDALTYQKRWAYRYPWYARGLQRRS